MCNLFWLSHYNVITDGVDEGVFRRLQKRLLNSRISAVAYYMNVGLKGD